MKRWMATAGGVLVVAAMAVLAGGRSPRWRARRPTASPAVNTSLHTWPCACSATRRAMIAASWSASGCSRADRSR
jgi:hypothetical protein